MKLTHKEVIQQACMNGHSYESYIDGALAHGHDPISEAMFSNHREMFEQQINEAELDTILPSLVSTEVEGPDVRPFEDEPTEETIISDASEGEYNQPTYTGVYNVECYGHWKFFSFWDGETWAPNCGNVANARAYWLAHPTLARDKQDLPWRGQLNVAHPEEPAPMAHPFDAPKSDEMVLSEVFAPGTEPGMVGIYFTEPEPHKYGNKCRVYQHWDGEFWYSFSASFYDAHRLGSDGKKSDYQNPYWQGRVVVEKVISQTAGLVNAMPFQGEPDANTMIGTAYPGLHKPVRVGVYCTDDGGGLWNRYQSWNGNYWGTECADVAAAAKYSARKSVYQNRDWRGVYDPVQVCVDDAKARGLIDKSGTPVASPLVNPKKSSAREVQSLDKDPDSTTMFSDPQNKAVHPIESGMYQLNAPSLGGWTFYAYWDGKWFQDCGTFNCAMKNYKLHITRDEGDLSPAIESWRGAVKFTEYPGVARATTQPFTDGPDSTTTYSESHSREEVPEQAGIYQLFGHGDWNYFAYWDGTTWYGDTRGFWGATQAFKEGYKHPLSASIAQWRGTVARPALSPAATPPKDPKPFGRIGPLTKVPDITTEFSAAIPAAVSPMETGVYQLEVPKHSGWSYFAYWDNESHEWFRDCVGFDCAVQNFRERKFTSFNTEGKLSDLVESWRGTVARPALSPAAAWPFATDVKVSTN